MGWKHCAIPISGCNLEVQEIIEQRWLAAGTPEGVTMFGRNTDDGVQILLLTPPAIALFGDLLSPLWIDAPDPRNVGWTFWCGAQDSWERFGLRSVEEMAAGAKPHRERIAPAYGFPSTLQKVAHFLTASFGN